MRKTAFGANRFGQNFTSPLPPKKCDRRILIPFSRQKSLKSLMLKNRKFGVSYQWYGSDFVIGALPLKKNMSLAGR